MIINDAGEYTLKYTATDACGKSTVVERELIVEVPPTYRTVIYNDGTFIINESSRDEEDNIIAHGAAKYIYSPFDPNGTTNIQKYIFSSTADAPWASRVTEITRIEIGSIIHPTSTAYWFAQIANATSADLSLLDTSNVTSMASMFSGTSSLEELDLSNFDTSNVTDMQFMFSSCGVESLDLSSFNTSSVITMKRMFATMQRLKTLNILSLNTSNVTDMEGMFINAGRNTFVGGLDVSSFDTSSVTNMSNMFRNFTRISTIYASPLFVVSQVTSSSDMFDYSTALVGGSGTTYSSSNPKDKTYAHIDGGVSDPGYFTAKS